jgi:uncharacterized membrane protein
MTRILRHLFTPTWIARRTFPARAFGVIESVIRESEQIHRGEIRFAVEAALDLAPLLRGISARERAVQVFSELRVWDTEENAGVLVYLLLADRDVEIVCDRGINARVAQQEWNSICQRMEQAFGRGEFEAGVISGIAEIGALLARYFPAQGARAESLPDRPVIL